MGEPLRASPPPRLLLSIYPASYYSVALQCPSGPASSASAQESALERDRDSEFALRAKDEAESAAEARSRFGAAFAQTKIYPRRCFL